MCLYVSVGAQVLKEKGERWSLLGPDLPLEHCSSPSHYIHLKNENVANSKTRIFICQISDTVGSHFK